MHVATIVAVIAIVAIAGSVQTLTGFGFALLSTPLLAAVVAPREAVVVSVLYGSITAITMSWQFRHTIDRPVLWRMCVGRVAGMPFGAWILGVISPAALRLTIAVAVVVSTWLLARGFRMRRGGATVDVAAGVLSGALTTSVSTGGPPLVIAMQSRGMDPDTFRGTMSAVSLYTSAIAIAVLAFSHRFTPDAIRALLVGMPGLLVGVLVGKWLVPRVDAARFRHAVLALLLAAAAISAASVIWG